MAKKALSTTEVFGVSNEPIATYVERKAVDDLFNEGLTRNKHIIVYGASKQGKTSLTNKHLKIDDFIRVNCSHNSAPVDLYKSVIRQLDIEFSESKETTNTVGGEPKVGIKAHVKIPFLGGVEASGEAGGKFERETRTSFKSVEFNLELAQDVSELLKSVKFKKRIILENFHYLSEDAQQQLAFDLRVFEDYNILFIILGIWREKNRLGQFNGDLLDRVIEIPVEPWENDDLEKIIAQGESLLNVNFQSIKNRLIVSCFDSVGVVQELCKEVCWAAGVKETAIKIVKLSTNDLDTAIKSKINDYSSRHIKALETFVEQRVRNADEVPLYIPYYFIKVLFNAPLPEVIEGIKRKTLQEKIKELHHRADDVRSSDIGYFLKNIVASQNHPSCV